MPGILLSGALGRMGRQIAALCGEYGFHIAAGVDVRSGEAAFPLCRAFSLCGEKCDVVMDFSRAVNCKQAVRCALERGVPLVMGTTGLGDAQRAMLLDASARVPVFYAASFSMGVHALTALAKSASALLPGWDVEIVERHHAGKPDAPSGTALHLFEAVKGADARARMGRRGAACAREKGEVGLHSVRGGTLGGRHEVGFYGEDESLYILHDAQSRVVFARGALRAAEFILSRPPGLYGMDDLAKGAP